LNNSNRIGHLDTVSALEFHQEFLYSGSYDSSVKRWNSTTGSIDKEYVKHTDRVTTIQIGPKFLYSGSIDATVRVWDKETAIAIYVINCKF
jgi:WD40 repeat protein